MGKYFKIHMVIKNIGEKQSPQSYAAIGLVNEATPLQFIIPPLHPNSTFNVKRIKKLSAAKTYRITGYVDHSGSIHECNENNNQKYVDVKIKQKKIILLKKKKVY